MAGEGSADGSACMYMGWHPYHISLTKLNADADIGHAEYAYLAGFNDLIAVAIKEAEGNPNISKIQQNLPCFPSLATISTYFLLIGYQNKL
jgi:hypothetical protein